MKVCTNCNIQFEDFSTVCPSCGNNLIPVSQNFNAAQNFSPTYANNQPMYANVNTAPGLKLQTNRSLVKFILLSIITIGIYSLVVLSKVSTDINIIASKYDGKKTMHYCIVVFLLTAITLGIFPLVWFHKLSNRIGTELKRRGINYSFSAGTFWCWSVLGILLLGVGPFVYIHKLLKAMNLLSESYNQVG